MPAVRSGHVRSIVLGVAAAILVGAPAALAQTSVKAIFEKYNLLGTLA
jgi:hypothetical protein